MRCPPPKLTVGTMALAEFSSVKVRVGLPWAFTAKSTVLLALPAVALTVAAPDTVGSTGLIATYTVPSASLRPELL